MEEETRTAVHDSGLEIEACLFEGLTRPFPNHFHEYYVIGLVERGERRLLCQNREYLLRPGDLLLLGPGDSHACVQRGGRLDYRALHIPQKVMLDLAEEITGRRELPGFSPKVVADREAACCLERVHRLVMEGGGGLDREEGFLLLLSLLLGRYGRPFGEKLPDCREEVERVRAFLEEHWEERVSLDQLARLAGLSKPALLRAFAREKGITPYRCLENIRVAKAQRLLEEGTPPAEAALRAGFSDQSHFTNRFSRFIGLSPGAYREIFLDKGED